MMRLHIAAAMLTVTLPASAAAPDWAGRYSFENGLGRNVPGTYMVINHRLTVGVRGCRIDAEGYQTDEHIICRAIPAGNTLSVNFVSYANGEIANAYGTILYKPGQTLFMLSRGPRGIVTRWRAYRPDATRRSGAYFRRAR